MFSGMPYHLSPSATSDTHGFFNYLPRDIVTHMRLPAGSGRRLDGNDDGEDEQGKKAQPVA